MSEMKPYLDRTREAWTGYNTDFHDMGRASWSTDEIKWGIWSLPESTVGALGDLSLLKGIDAVELGCGTAYFSAWLMKHGAKPVGIDLTPAQLESARAFQKEFGLWFPLCEGNAEATPFPSESFDLALSEYGASIWCDPYRWIPEAARLLRPGGVLVFLRNSPLSMICTPGNGPVGMTLLRPWFGLHQIEWNEKDPLEFSLNPGDMFRLLRRCGFELEDLIELQAPAGAVTRFDYVDAEWGHRWPTEEIWRARKR